MNNTFPNRAIFFVIFSLGITLIQPTTAHAAGFSMPAQFTHAGLSFTSPLPFNKPLHIPTPTKPISFLPVKKLTLTKPSQKQKRLEEIIVTPQATHEDPLIPTPTIYSAPEQALVEATSTQAPTPSPLPRLYTPVPSPSTVPTTQPVVTATQLANPGGLNADKLFAMANAYRANKGLPPLEKDDRSCSLAVSRAPEINAEIAEGRMHSGLRARNLPYWNTENIISMNSEESAFNWWINDTIHREAIEGNYKYSCVACSGNACAQEFTNFQAK